jgi:hypothetical protein
MEVTKWLKPSVRGSQQPKVRELFAMHQLVLPNRRFGSKNETARAVERCAQGSAWG